MLHFFRFCAAFLALPPYYHNSFLSGPWSQWLINPVSPQFNAFDLYSAVVLNSLAPTARTTVHRFAYSRRRDFPRWKHKTTKKHVFTPGFERTPKLPSTGTMEPPVEPPPDQLHVASLQPSRLTGRFCPLPTTPLGTVLPSRELRSTGVKSQRTAVKNATFFFAPG